LGIDPEHSALFIGGVDSSKDIDFLMEVARLSRELNPRFTLLVVGAGEEASKVIEEEQRSGSVRFLGHRTDHLKTLALATSRLMVIPDSIGLVAVESLAVGLPIVTRDNCSHGPEAAYLRPGVDSLWMSSRATALSFAGELTNLMGNDSRLDAMRTQCLKRSRDYGMSSMVERFADGVQQFWEYAGSTSR
jgi:glycosyltransferase involved in cell wall biosynthesis